MLSYHLDLSFESRLLLPYSQQKNINTYRKRENEINPGNYCQRMSSSTQELPVCFSCVTKHMHASEAVTAMSPGRGKIEKYVNKTWYKMGT